MGLTDFFSDLYASLTPIEAYAEAPESDNDEDKEEQGGEEKSDEGEKKEEGGDDEGGDEGGEEGGGNEGGDDEEGGDDAEEEEEEEEEEPVDPRPKIEEACSKSKECAPVKHHYDECAERVHQHEQKAAEGKAKGPKEDCVEEFFHLTHCAMQCAAPKLWQQLK